MSETYICALCAAAASATPGDDLLYAFSLERGSWVFPIESVGGNEVEESAALTLSEHTHSLSSLGTGPCPDKEAPARSAHSVRAAVERLLRTRFSLEYTLEGIMEEVLHNDTIYIPCVCILHGSAGFTLENYRACRLDRSDTLLTLPWEEPFGKILANYIEYRGAKRQSSP